MFTRLTSIIAAAGLLLLASAAAAQPNLAAGLDNVLRAPQGTWAEYKMSKSGVDKTLTMRASLVLRSKKLIVQEFAMATPMGKVLTRIEYIPAGKGAWKVAHGMIKVGQTPPRAVPMPSKAVTIKRGQTPGKLLGTVKLKTKAGTFTCKRYKRDQARAGAVGQRPGPPHGPGQGGPAGRQAGVGGAGQGRQALLRSQGGGQGQGQSQGQGQGRPKKHKHTGKHKH